ncbi:hypothetical protein HMI55_001238 [Coelomomyces lativittatus]|nr:hypothetical protein HMI55_001238 [Coelomomyces lativittatus]KAJ1514707.1 hypothetical protein HMI56_007618 [Coelomomyces lativittatus]
MQTHPSFLERLDTLDRTFMKVEDSWTYHMRLFIDALKILASTHSTKFLVLMNRLDFNFYYGGKQRDALTAT